MLFYYLSLCSIVDICLPFWSEWEHAKGWHFLDVIARGAPFKQNPFCLCLSVGFHFGLAFMCSVHLYAEMYLACVAAFAHHSSLRTALHHRTSHQSKMLLVPPAAHTQVGTLLRHSQFLRSNKCAHHQTQTLGLLVKSRLVGQDPALHIWISFSLLTKPLFKTF